MGQFAVVAVVKDGIRKEFIKIHLSEADAHKEAKRLCRLENKPFLVIEIIGRHYQEEKPLAYEKIRED